MATKILGGIPFVTTIVTRVHKLTREARTFEVPVRPVDPTDGNRIFVSSGGRAKNSFNDELTEVDATTAYLPDDRVWQITDEDAEAAIAEGKRLAEVDIQKSEESERKKLTKVWGEIAERTGRTMEDLFPSVFGERSR